MATSPATLPTEPVIVTLPHGQVAKLRPYVTGRMSIATRAVFLKHMNVNPKEAFSSQGGGAPTEEQARDAVSFDDIPGDVINEINEITVTNMVIELDGSTEDILDRALDMPSADYEALVAECNKIDKATTVSSKKKLK